MRKWEKRSRKNCIPLLADCIAWTTCPSATNAQEHCKEIIRGKGLEKISVDELVDEITPRGRATVPDDIKAELLQRIRKFLQST